LVSTNHPYLRVGHHSRKEEWQLVGCSSNRSRWCVCAELGVRRELTAPYTPTGVIERRNQSIMSGARCMLKAKELPGMFFGGRAINCAVYLLNRSVSKGAGSKTPYEL
jgi:hypothetical protein